MSAFDDGFLPSDEPLGETMHADLADVAIVPDDPAELDHVLRVELDLLVSLAWAPPAVTTTVVEAIVGAAAERPRADRLPVGSPLFVSTVHERMWAGIVDLVDAGAPVTPTLLANHLGSGRSDAKLSPVLLELASPSGRAPLPGGADTPHLAVAVVDQWYDRGYRALAARLSSLLSPHAGTAREDYAEHWARLTVHQQAAAARWKAVRDALSS